MKPLVASACLGVAATVVAWPRSSRGRRRRLALGRGDRPSRVELAQRALAMVRFEPRVATAGAAFVCGVCAAAVGGPVAAIVASVYAALAAQGLLRRHRQRAAVRARASALDDLGGMAADLRAGLPPPALSISDVDADVGGRADAAFALAEATGAPVADLLDRIEADARARDRAAAAAEAQRAGVRATAVLLAGLPIAGIALGYAIGADPVHVLLRTPLGAGCALAALALQVAGLAWSARLAGAVP